MKIRNGGGMPRLKPLVRARAVLGALGAAALLAGAAAHAQTVSDYSFESPSVGSGYVYVPNGVPGATFTGGAGVQGNGGAWGFTPAPDGTQTAFLQSSGGSNGSITLDVTGLTPGTYTANFYTEARPGYTPVDVLVTWDGGTVETFVPSDPNNWQPGPSFPFLVGSTSGQLEFQTAFVPSTGDNDMGIDDVTLTRVGGVPEPAAWALMLVGVGGVGAMLRRGRAAVTA
jgi:hypothetical protein